MPNSDSALPQFSYKKRLLSNILSNWAGYAVGIVVSFLLTPYILASIGQTRYGIWALASTLTGYYGLLDLGFRAGVTQYLTRHLAAGNSDSLNKSASTGFFTLMGCGVFVLAGTTLVATLAHIFFHVPPGLLREVRLVILVVGASAAIEFVFFTYSAVFTAVQRFDISNGIGICTRLLSASFIIFALKMGYGLVGISIAMSCANLIDYLLRWRFAVGLLPSLRIAPSLVNYRSLMDFASFGFWNFIIRGSTRLISCTDALVIAAYMPVSAVTPFALAASLRDNLDNAFAPVGQVFFPAATEMDAKGRVDELRKLYLTGSRGMFLLSFAVGSVAILCSSGFFRLWVGPRFAQPTGYPAVSFLFSLLAIGSIVTSGQRIGYQVLMGMRKIRLLAVLFIAEGLANLIVSLALVRTWGLVGVAIGTTAPALLFQGIVQPFFVCGVLGISWWAYIREVVLRPCALALVFSLGIIGARYLEPVAGWGALVALAAAGSCLALLSLAIIGLKTDERKTLLFSPARGLARRLRALLYRCA